MTGLAEIIRAAQPKATEDDCIVVADRLRNAAGAIVRVMAKPHFEIRVKPEVWMQLCEELAETLAHTALSKVTSLLEAVTEDDYR